MNEHDCAIEGHIKENFVLTSYPPQYQCKICGHRWSEREINKSDYGLDYWFKFRDSIYEVGKPNFSIVSNGSDEHPDKNVIRISDCKFNVFIDISCFGDRQDAIERAEALCKLLNANYPFYEPSKSDPDSQQL